ncbi:MAG TPA: hypothetical protein VH227_01310 [Candidatus Udaeobacter sp.]|nr:hypothetical protein [Candidatus Udaeobacter sp.]
MDRVLFFLLEDTIYFGVNLIGNSGHENCLIGVHNITFFREQLALRICFEHLMPAWCLLFVAKPVCIYVI